MGQIGKANGNNFKNTLRTACWKNEDSDSNCLRNKIRVISSKKSEIGSQTFQLPFSCIKEATEIENVYVPYYIKPNELSIYQILA